MFKKLLAAVGVGGAKVDTVVKQAAFVPGDRIEAEILVQGGEVEQEIEGLAVRLMTEVEIEVGDSKLRQPQVLAEWRVAFQGNVAARSQQRIPFAAELPWETPITVVPGLARNVRVWLHTGLAIDEAIDASDKDLLAIHPTPSMRQVLSAVEAAGFVPFSADVESGQLRGNGFHSTLGCYQEIEYRPAGLSRGLRIKEVELSFVARPGQLHVLVEIDRIFGRDGWRSLSFSAHTPDEEIRSRVAALFQ